ncbi:hypothetical protein E8E78_09915 [Pseudomonas sp. BN505]|uniref:hypothetical protein n=1 Tax=unclassified Pseudomonas TaxID=196821 RepID=UPI0024588AC8|nr:MULTISPECIES: hypothetical protein [unclassified Pseudomonas]MDH4843347.1 hypothetical protein [Pseudomonas sp. BN605]MDH4856907.1 hypothetical protein [Pseudomonas sp. BN505]
MKDRSGSGVMIDYFKRYPEYAMLLFYEVLVDGDAREIAIISKRLAAAGLIPVEQLSSKSTQDNQ